jgi:hypothetical protein
MATSTRSVATGFIVAGISIVLTVVAGLDWIGQPLRMVQLITIIGLSMTSGVSWAQAVMRLRERRREHNNAA